MEKDTQIGLLSKKYSSKEVSMEIIDYSNTKTKDLKRVSDELLKIKTKITEKCPEKLVIESMARVGYEEMFEDEWDNLHKKSIDRVLWLNVASSMLKELRRLWELKKKSVLN